ncbi:MAG: hypothetical protein K5654_06885 [Lachnospiraceae bacterium]|nr:hypothetical protein [Lachnospiraceae bacterium]
MDKKTALIIMYIGTAVPGLGLIGFLIALLAGKKEVVGGRNLTQGLILMLAQCIGWILIGLGPIFALVFSIIALVKVFKGDLDPELPLIGGLNWFDK